MILEAYHILVVLYHSSSFSFWIFLAHFVQIAGRGKSPKFQNDIILHAKHDDKNLNTNSSYVKSIFMKIRIEPAAFVS